MVTIFHSPHAPPPPSFPKKIISEYYNQIYNLCNAAKQFAPDVYRYKLMTIDHMTFCLSILKVCLYEDKIDKNFCHEQIRSVHSSKHLLYKI